MSHPVELEICAESLQACHAAAEGGADRIELCSALDGGGVTPSRSLIRAAVAGSSIPVHVLLRPRNGNFVYSGEEHAVMCGDLEDAFEAGAAGVVAGALTAGGEIDQLRMRDLLRLAAGRPVTFHRAFDQLHNLSIQLERVIDLGCQRVLTSGGHPSVTAGILTLAMLAEQAAGRIRIAAGGGVTLENAASLARIQGLDIHASLRRPAGAQAETASDPLWQQSRQNGAIRLEDVQRLRHLVNHSSSRVVDLGREG